MAALFRRVWESVSPFSTTSSALAYETNLSYTGNCLFDQISADILISIFSLLPAKDLASASLVCKVWFSVARNERLWESLLVAEAGNTWPGVLFAETQLRAGPCFRSPEEHFLSYHQVYNERRQSPCSVIIDGGSGYCKFGWGNFNRPIGRLPTFLEFGNIESPMFPLLRDFFATIYGRLSAKPSSQPVVISTPICYSDDTEIVVAARHNLREVTYSALFDIGVPAICAVDQAVLALYATNFTSGIVVNIGFQVTSIVPILHGKVMRNIGVEVVGQGALHLTGFLRELMQQNNIAFKSITTVKALKENLCYVAQNYEEEFHKNTEASYTVENVGQLTLKHERFITSEILFQPRLGGLKTMSLHQAVALCMHHCADIAEAIDVEGEWYKTVVLAGGTACLPGLAERLEKELRKILPLSWRQGLMVIPPQQGAESVWFGAKLLSNLSNFRQAWCITKKEYRRYGASILHRKALDSDYVM